MLKCTCTFSVVPQAVAKLDKCDNLFHLGYQSLQGVAFCLSPLSVQPTPLANLSYSRFSDMATRIFELEEPLHFITWQLQNALYNNYLPNNIKKGHPLYGKSYGATYCLVTINTDHIKPSLECQLSS